LFTQQLWAEGVEYVFSADPVWFMPLLVVNIAADQEAFKTLFF